jgi:hypothetical protein
MTLKQAIEHAHCRVGKADGTTKDGAYWLAASITIRQWGGDGIGQSSPSHTSSLDLRHYRDGAIRARCHHATWHQNGSYSGGNVSEYFGADAVLDCETVEEVIVKLKGIRYYEEYGDYSTPVYGNGMLTVDDLKHLNIPEAAPSPDEVIEAQT